MERRKCEYREFEAAQIGFCIAITGGVYDPPVAVIERLDGTMTTVPIYYVQFLDVAPWDKMDDLR